MELNENSPRHEQISNWLREQIMSETYTVGDRLPSEHDLRKKFDVSRVTIRHALKTLQSEGLIERRQGLGSFVANFQLQQPFVCLTDFSEDMQREGIQAASQVISNSLVRAEPKISEKLDIKSNAKVVRLERVRLGNDLPVAYDITWLPLFYGQLLQDHDLNQDTIYRILEDEYEIPIRRGEYRITAANAGADMASHLNIEPHSATLQINRITYTTGEKKVYYQTRYYRPDRICYQLQLERADEACERFAQGMPLKEFAPLFFDSE